VTRTTDAGRAAVAVSLVAGVALALVAMRAVRGQPGGPAKLSVTSAVVSEGEDVAAGYLTIENKGGSDRLAGVTSDAGTVAIHRTTNRNGTDVMEPSAAVPIGAGATVRLAPGGTHLMIEPLRQPLRPGEEITLTLRFAHSDPVTVRASVASYSEIASSLEGSSGASP
jgi:hypothetical protein